MFKLLNYFLWAQLAIFSTRISAASNASWPCTNGENIPLTKLCDGSVDCSNGRDETMKVCLTNLCKDDQYRCAYGACIRNELKCNNQIDCFDRSDEIEFLCGSDDEVWAKMQGSCTDEEYQCISGECIDEFAACDGWADCSDGSDESVDACAHIICNNYSFRCGYGACISVDQVCNKIWDCADGSDELCYASSEKDDSPDENLTTNTCTIPYEDFHLQVRLGGTKRLLHTFDIIMRNDTVEFECSAGFELVGVDRLVCVDNSWYRLWPKCTVQPIGNFGAAMVSSRFDCFEVTCDCGECIEQAALCDGVKDCADGSDETPWRCLGRNCTTGEFQCKYGACIPNARVCDEKQHCADGSDETRLLCIEDDEEYFRIVQGECLNDGDEELAECLSGDCIPLSQLCDGIPNCSDRSDETVEMCAHTKCPNTHFTCAYGACIPSCAQCNGRVDCADGSDEMRELCEYVEAERAKQEEQSNFDDSFEANIDKIEALEEHHINEAKEQGEHEMTADRAKPEGTVQKSPSLSIRSGAIYRQCTIPVDRMALRAVLAADNATLKVGSPVNIGAIVTFSCDDTWLLVGEESELLCMPLGEWSAVVPKCEKRCSPQWSGISTTITCSYQDAAVDCGTYLKPGAKAAVECARGYRPIMQRTELHCGLDGEWDATKFKCQPQCAVATTVMELPKSEMLVKIFKLSTNKDGSAETHFKLECQGTIISPKLVLTSALCFSSTDIPNMAANDPFLYSILPARTQIEHFNSNAKDLNRHNISQIILAEDFADEDLDPPAIVVLVDYFVIVPRVTLPICMKFIRSCLNTTNKEIPAGLRSDMKGVAFSSNDCLVIIGHSELIYMEKYRQWLEMHISSYTYLL